MRNLSLLLGAVLLVQGVFGVDEVTVSVMVGDSLTLNSDFTETKGDVLQWRIKGESDIIAQIDREANKISVPGNDEERFRDRLKLDHQTGSLTIMNIRNTDSRVYELKIKDSMNENTCRFTVTVRDVFFVGTDGVKSVSVTEGDTVTLHTGVTPIQKDDQILWKFGDQDLNGAVDSRWRNINLNDQTKDLNISNIRRDQTGVYTVEINTSRIILHRKFRISIDVFSDEEDGVKTVSETKGDSVLLHTHVTHIQQNDPIEWTFGPQNIPVAKTDGKSESISYNYNDERFKNRLYLDIRTGDLTIKKSSTEHSGLYQLKIITSSYTIQKSFSVAVSDSGLSVGAVAGIVVGVLLLVLFVAAVAGLIYHRHKISELKRLEHAKNNGTNDPLNAETANSDDL